MGHITKINSSHPLVGTWVGEGEDSRCQYTIRAYRGRFTVKAVDAVDGEELVISNVSWDGKALRFESVMPSTGRIGVNELRPISPEEIEFKFTFTITEKWRKKTTTTKRSFSAGG